MEKQKPDIVSTVFTLINVSLFHVGFGLLLSIIPLVVLSVTSPDSFPLKFWSGLLCGSPAGYLYLWIIRANKSLTAMHSCLIGALLCFFTLLIGYWNWFALTSYGLDAYSESFFLGLGLASCLPFCAYSMAASTSS